MRPRAWGPRNWSDSGMRGGAGRLQPHRAWVGERKSLQHLETTVPICLDLTEPVFCLQNEDVVTTSPACGEDSMKDALEELGPLSHSSG